MIEFLAGAVAMACFVAGLYFLRFWRKTGDRLFLSFAIAFWLMAANQTLVSVWGAADERSGYAYILRVLGFIIILFAIADKNWFSWRRRQ
jgi:hypothetical protein